MSEASLGWEPLFKAWQINISKELEILNDCDLSALFMRFCPVLLYFVRKSGAQVI